MKIAIFGASGFIGQAFIQELIKDPHNFVYAYARSGGKIQHPQLIYKSVDLFSLSELEEAWEDQIDIAYYFIHSMLPTARLDQGHFADFDLLLADNFLRIAKKKKLKKIIYLTGIVPNLPTGKLSWHLRSRKEVEELFQNSGLPLLVVRTGIIIGSGGSSFQMMKSLIENLPVMICPSWTNTKMNACGLDELIDFLAHESIQSDHRGIVEFGFPTSTTYRELIKLTATIMKKKRQLIPVPYFSLYLSRWWVVIFGQAPLSLVGPLIGSLKYSMTFSGTEGVKVVTRGDLAISIKKALLDEKVIHAFRKKNFGDDFVRSIQRYQNSAKIGDAVDISSLYFDWLPGFFKFFIKVRLEEDKCIFWLPSLNLDLLVLKKEPGQSEADRFVLSIVGGLLANEQKNAMMEFRVTTDQRFILAAIHRYVPALPWYIYRYSQAMLHAVVMKSFGRYLRKGIKV